jgi:uncharacterized protein DUF3592
VDSVTFPREWTPPQELGGERPRSVRLTAAGIVLSVLSILMLVAALPIVVAMRVADARSDARTAVLRREGQDIDAEVTRLRRVGKDRQPRVAYAFVVGEARYQADVEAPLSRWEDLRVGGRLAVRYLPSDPATNHPVAWDRSPFGPMPPAVTAGFLVLIGGLLRYTLRRDRRLLEDGVPSAGVVTRVHRMKGGYATHYQFRVDDGEVRRGRGPLPRRLETGAILPVIADRDNPRRNAPYPLKLYRVRAPEY